MKYSLGPKLVITDIINMVVCGGCGVGRGRRGPAGAGGSYYSLHVLWTMTMCWVNGTIECTHRRSAVSLRRSWLEWMQESGSIAAAASARLWRHAVTPPRARRTEPVVISRRQQPAPLLVNNVLRHFVPSPDALQTLWLRRRCRCTTDPVF